MDRGGSPSKVLLAILVYNGRSFVPTCIESAVRTRDADHDVDMVVLDDCSPDPGWSEELGDLCNDAGVGYYRSPRNLGIPRNMNLALLRGVSAGYDHVVLLNSDVVLPRRLVDVLVGVADANESVGSVTAWSNNVSVYSLPNKDPGRFLSSIGVVDFVSEALGGEFGPAGVEIPVAVGFCMLIPTPAIRRVGLFDPVFGRGYCEELDWSLRAKALGLRNILAPSTFVYHSGSGSTRDAALLPRGCSTVMANERIVDWRYPLFRSQVEAFMASEIPDRMTGDGLRRIVLCAARDRGYEVEASWLEPAGDADASVRFVITPDGSGLRLFGHSNGFVAPFPVDRARGVLGTVEHTVGIPPRRVSIRDRGRSASQLLSEAEAAKVPILEGVGYPTRV